jgi:hypothetical protein
VVLDGVGNRWITVAAVQDEIFCSIEFHVLKHAVESDITKAAGKWRLKVDLEGPLSAKCMNNIRMITEDTVTAMMCIAALKEGVVSLQDPVIFLTLAFLITGLSLVF